MKKFTQLTLKERYQISACIKVGFSNELKTKKRDSKESLLFLCLH